MQLIAGCHTGLVKRALVEAQTTQTIPCPHTIVETEEKNEKEEFPFTVKGRGGGITAILWSGEFCDGVHDRLKVERDGVEPADSSTDKSGLTTQNDPIEENDGGSESNKGEVEGKRVDMLCPREREVTVGRVDGTVTAYLLYEELEVDGEMNKESTSVSWTQRESPKAVRSLKLGAPIAHLQMLPGCGRQKEISNRVCVEPGERVKIRRRRSTSQEAKSATRNTCPRCGGEGRRLAAITTNGHLIIVEWSGDWTEEQADSLSKMDQIITPISQCRWVNKTWTVTEMNEEVGAIAVGDVLESVDLPGPVASAAVGPPVCSPGADACDEVDPFACRYQREAVRNVTSDGSGYDVAMNETKYPEWRRCGCECPGFNYIVFGGYHNQVRVWGIRERTIVWSGNRIEEAYQYYPPPDVRALCFIHPHNYPWMIAMGNQNGQIRLFDFLGVDRHPVVNKAATNDKRPITAFCVKRIPHPSPSDLERKSKSTSTSVSSNRHARRTEVSQTCVLVVGDNQGMVYQFDVRAPQQHHTQYNQVKAPKQIGSNLVVDQVNAPSGRASSSTAASSEASGDESGDDPFLTLGVDTKLPCDVLALHGRGGGEVYSYAQAKREANWHKRKMEGDGGKDNEEGEATKRLRPSDCIERYEDSEARSFFVRKGTRPFTSFNTVALQLKSKPSGDVSYSYEPLQVELVKNYRGVLGGVTSMGFHPDGVFLSVAGLGRVVTVFDTVKKSRHRIAYKVNMKQRIGGTLWSQLPYWPEKVVLNDTDDDDDDDDDDGPGDASLRTV
eukprot:GHVN01031275.1.p1 GENE.GHVN01031275.1~~GHVN01031275.1.p1  ORF type:complete len:783 (+),score=168.06 GHVN01031275.1:85-2433(+)